MVIRGNPSDGQSVIQRPERTGLARSAPRLTRHVASRGRAHRTGPQCPSTDAPSVIQSPERTGLARSAPRLTRHLSSRVPSAPDWPAVHTPQGRGIQPEPARSLGAAAARKPETGRPCLGSRPTSTNPAPAATAKGSSLLGRMNSLQQTHEVRLRGLACCGVGRTVWRAPRPTMVVQTAAGTHEIRLRGLATMGVGRTVWRAHGWGEECGAGELSTAADVCCIDGCRRGKQRRRARGWNHRGCR